MDPLQKAVETSWYIRMQNEAVARERERCAKIVEGVVLNERYREWPWWGPGNRNKDSEMVRFCDFAAAEIRNPRPA